jgi:hypothetical protein
MRCRPRGRARDRPLPHRPGQQPGPLEPRLRTAKQIDADVSFLGRSNRHARRGGGLTCHECCCQSAPKNAAFERTGIVRRRESPSAAVCGFLGGLVAGNGARTLSGDYRPTGASGLAEFTATLKLAVRYLLDMMRPVGAGLDFMSKSPFKWPRRITHRRGFCRKRGRSYTRPFRAKMRKAGLISK